MKKSTLILLLFVCAFALSACDRDSQEGKETYEDVKDLIEEFDSGKAGVRGSCDVIGTKSSCIDFVGSVFTEERMKLSCEEGKFSKNTCPYSELGGCQSTPGAISESVIWSYSYGGEPLSKEEAEYAKKACNATGVSKWITPDEFNNIKSN